MTNPDKQAPPGNGRDHVQSLARGLAVLKAFSAEQPELTLSEVARQCDLTRSAARRFLLTLTDLGYVGVDGRNFYLRSPVLELGYLYLSSLQLPDVARPHLEQLSAELQRPGTVSSREARGATSSGCATSSTRATPPSLSSCCSRMRRHRAAFSSPARSREPR